MRALRRYWFFEAPAARLAALRILVGGFAAGYVIARAPHLFGYASFNADLFRPVGVVSVLSSPLPAWISIAMTAATIVTSLCFVCGWRFRIFGPAFALLLLWTLSYRNSWRMIFHTENLFVLHVLILGFARSADAWSLDSRTQGQEKVSGDYGWPIRAMMLIVVVAYLLAGIAKFRWGGVGWMDGEVLRNLVATDTVRKMLLGSFYSPVGGAMVNMDFAFKSFAILTVVFEAGAPLALLGGRITTAWVVVAIGFHWGVQLIMMITFPYPMFGFAFACFFPIEIWWLAWRRRRRRRRRGRARAMSDPASPPTV